MTESADQARGRQAGDPNWRRPANGSLVAGAGAVTTLVSMFLPWYTLRLRVTNYASLSAFAILRVPHAALSCYPLRPGCHISLRVGALVGGIWDWRPMIAVGAAAVVLYLAVKAMQPGPPGDWRVVTALAAGTAVVALAAAVVNPLSVPGEAERLGMTAALSYGVTVGLAGAVVAILGGLLLGGPSARAGPRLPERAP